MRTEARHDCIGTVEHTAERLLVLHVGGEELGARQGRVVGNKLAGAAHRRHAQALRERSTHDARPNEAGAADDD